MLQFLKSYENFCHVFGIDANQHFFLSTDVYAGQPLEALLPIILIIVRGRSVMTE